MEFPYGYIIGISPFKPLTHFESSVPVIFSTVESAKNIIRALETRPEADLKVWRNQMLIKKKQTPIE